MKFLFENSCCHTTKKSQRALAPRCQWGRVVYKRAGRTECGDDITRRLVLLFADSADSLYDSKTLLPRPDKRPIFLKEHGASPQISLQERANHFANDSLSSASNASKSITKVCSLRCVVVRLRWQKWRPMTKRRISLVIQTPKARTSAVSMAPTGLRASGWLPS